MKSGPRPFTSHVKMMVLTMTLPHAGRWFYQRELQMLTSIAYTPVRAALLDLEAFGLLKKRTHGNRQYYMVDKDFFLYDEYKRIVLKTVGLGDHLRYRRKNPEDILVAFIHGDFADGRETTESPIDVCVVGKMSKQKFDEALAAARMFTLKEYRLLVLRPDEFASRCRKKEPELLKILAGRKMFMVGRPEDLDRLMANGKA